MKYKSIILATSMLVGVGCAHAAQTNHSAAQKTASVRLFKHASKTSTAGQKHASSNAADAGDQLSSVPGTVTNSNIDDLTSKIYIAGQKLKLATLQAKIAVEKAKEKKAQSGGTGSSNSGQQYSGMNHFPQMMAYNQQGPGYNGQPQQKSKPTPAPQVVSIFGFNNQIQADLEMSNGQTLTVVPGETINDGLKILSINQYGVLAKVNKKKVMLTFGGGSMPTKSGQSANASGPGSSAQPPVIYGMSAPALQQHISPPQGSVSNPPPVPTPPSMNGPKSTFGHPPGQSTHNPGMQ